MINIRRNCSFNSLLLKVLNLGYNKRLNWFQHTRYFKSTDFWNNSSNTVLLKISFNIIFNQIWQISIIIWFNTNKNLSKLRWIKCFTHHKQKQILFLDKLKELAFIICCSYCSISRCINSSSIFLNWFYTFNTCSRMWRLIDCN